MSKNDNPHWGTTLDAFLADEGISEATTKGFNDLVQRRAAADPKFAAALLREGIDTAFPLTMAYRSPTFFGVIYASRLFGEIEATNSLAKFRHAIGERPDLRNREHARALLEWLNSWGCRITKIAFPSISDRLAEWFDGREFPVGEIHKLQDRELDMLAGAYGGLLGIKEFGPTAAAKALFALCPDAAIPWDAAIQQQFDCVGSAPDMYRKMLELSGREAASLISDAARCGIHDHRAIPDRAKSRATTLPELLDQYHWVTITRRHKIPDEDELNRWAALACGANVQHAIASRL